MAGDQPGQGGAGMAPLGRTLAIARPATRRLILTALLGAGATAADIGLLATAAWLISKAAQHPNESQLAVAIVGVQFFGLSRGFFRYEERLVGHDAAFRLLADLRVRVYQRLERLAPTGLPAFRRGDLLARIVQDIDSLQDLVIRVIPPSAPPCWSDRSPWSFCGGCFRPPGSSWRWRWCWPPRWCPG